MRKIRQKLSRTHLRNINQEIIICVFKWWSRRGNRQINIESRKYRLFKTGFALFLVFGSILTVAYTGELVYLTVLQESQSTIANASIQFLLLIGVFFILTPLFLYVRRMRQHTFKKVATDRITLLKWDSRSRYFQWAILVNYQILVLTFFGSVLLNAILTSKLIRPDAIALPLSIYLAIMSAIFFVAIFSYLVFSLGIRKSEKSAYCLDFLAKIDELGKSDSRKITNKDISYVTETCIRELGRVILLDRYVGDELNIGSCLSTVLLGLFWGDKEEKERTARLLIRLRDMLLVHQHGLASRLVVSMLAEYCATVPDLNRIRETLSLSIEPVKRVSILKRLSENSVIITLIGVCIAFISFVVSRIFPK